MTTNSLKTIYDSTKRRHPAIEEFLVLFQYKDLVLQLIKRNIVTRYKRSVLGIAWTMLNPLGTMIVMSIVFSRVFNNTESYPVYILSSLVGWNFFSQTTTSCMNSMLWGSDLIKQIYLPRTSFVVSSVGSGIVNLLFSLVPLFLIMFFLHMSFNISLIMLPLAILILAFFTLGIGLILSSYVILFPDISEMYSIILTAWMYTTPIIVPEDVLSGIFNGWLLKLNPLYYILRLIRMTIYNGVFPTLEEWLIAICISIITLLLGWLIFTKKADSYAYNI